MDGIARVVRHARWTSDRRPAKPLILAAMSLGFCVVQLDVTIVNTALSSIGQSLRVGVAELQWVVSS
jgi:DHA2 family methylenomycin A resistance protein-like MFS transporter